MCLPPAWRWRRNLPSRLTRSVLRDVYHRAVADEAHELRDAVPGCEAHSDAPFGAVRARLGSDVAAQRTALELLTHTREADGTSVIGCGSDSGHVIDVSATSVKRRAAVVERAGERGVVRSPALATKDCELAENGRVWGPLCTRGGERKTYSRQQ